MTIGDLAHLGSPRGAQRDPAPQIARGRIVRAPASVNDTMVVALDRYALAFPYEVLSGRWPAGGRLPQSGDVCLVIFDDAGDAWVRGGAWQAVASMPPSGSAGGDLGGTYPNPTVQHVLNGQTPLTVLGSGASSAQLGHVAAVNADVGGWCNYAFPATFPTACDGVLAQNGFGGTSGNAFADVQPVDAGHFRAFINGAGLNADAYFIAWGH